MSHPTPFLYSPRARPLPPPSRKPLHFGTETLRRSISTLPSANKHKQPQQNLSVVDLPTLLKAAGVGLPLDLGSDFGHSFFESNAAQTTPLARILAPMDTASQVIAPLITYPTGQATRRRTSSSASNETCRSASPPDTLPGRGSSTSPSSMSSAWASSSLLSCSSSSSTTSSYPDRSYSSLADRFDDDPDGLEEVVEMIDSGPDACSPRRRTWHGHGLGRRKGASAGPKGSSGSSKDVAAARSSDPVQDQSQKARAGEDDICAEEEEDDGDRTEDERTESSHGRSRSLSHNFRTGVGGGGGSGSSDSGDSSRTSSKWPRSWTRSRTRSDVLRPHRRMSSDDEAAPVPVPALDTAKPAFVWTTEDPEQSGLAQSSAFGKRWRLQPSLDATLDASSTDRDDAKELLHVCTQGEARSRHASFCKASYLAPGDRTDASTSMSEADRHLLEWTTWQRALEEDEYTTVVYG